MRRSTHPFLISSGALASAVSLAAVAAACGADDEEPSPAPGARLFAEKGCVACHGSRGEGAFMGPPLRELASRWTREELARFFSDPAAQLRDDPRLSALAERYPAPMAPIVASASERLAIADWVLALE